jgi:4-carboxymuconolactone decarboxylase
MSAHKNDSIFLRGPKAPAEYFTGTAWVSPLVPKDETGTFSIGNVEFEPGSRNNWHTHPRGQILLITDGAGWYQERGKAARALTKGDVVVIPSGIEHWHGASRDSSLTHIAISNFGENGPVTWLGRVTEEEYAAVHDN